MACDTSVPKIPATRVNENENDVDDCDAGNACPQAKDGPQHAAEDAKEKANAFFAADEPEAREDKGCSAPVHAITPLLLFRRGVVSLEAGMPSWSHNRPAGLGVVHGPWESALQGNPRGAFIIQNNYTGQMSGGQSRKHLFFSVFSFLYVFLHTIVL